MKNICPECGYAAAQEAGCPMCVPCSGCGRKLMQCECIEGD